MSRSDLIFNKAIWILDLFSLCWGRDFCLSFASGMRARRASISGSIKVRFYFILSSFSCSFLYAIFAIFWTSLGTNSSSLVSIEWVWIDYCNFWISLMLLSLSAIDISSGESYLFLSLKTKLILAASSSLSLNVSVDDAKLISSGTNGFVVTLWAW